MSTCQKQAHICSSSCAFCKRTPPHVISTELRRSLRPEEEWRDPEDVSAAMLIQGILTMLYPRNRISWHQFSVQILSAWIELINRENLPFPLPSITGSAPSDHAGPRHLNRTPKVPPRTSPLVISTELRKFHHARRLLSSRPNSEGACDLRRSGEIPRMCQLPC